MIRKIYKIRAVALAKWLSGDESAQVFNTLSRCDSLIVKATRRALRKI